MLKRHEDILDLLAQRGECTVQTLAEHFDVSTMTIRRDLAALETTGDIKRTHGGAFLSRAGVIEFSFREKEKLAAAQKQAIAREVARCIQPGMAITLDTGTTTLEVARAIAAIENLTVVTSSLAIASALYAQDNIELILLGGLIRKGNPDLSGWVTEDNLKRFKVDFAILGADAADTYGVLTTDVGIARVSQAMIENARETILVVDHSKFERSAFVRFASWEDVSRVVTDNGIDPACRAWLETVARRVDYVEG